MPSREWHLRTSWSLDDLTDAMSKHFGYADRTAFVKSLIRGCALVGRLGNHAMLIRLSHESPAVQDKIDAELCRMWKDNEPLTEGALTKMAQQAVVKTGRSVTQVLSLSAEEIIARARRNGHTGGG